MDTDHKGPCYALANAQEAANIGKCYAGQVQDQLQDNPVSPNHYKTTSGLEAIDVIESFKLNYRLGSALKYILRAGKKGPADTDIRKAMWFLQRELDKGGDNGVGGDRTK